MGQAKQECPHCGRPPRGVHRTMCPRSRARLAAVSAALESVGRPRPRWLFGPQVVVVQGRRKHTDNPGIPYVGPGKPWFAGGLPERVRREVST